MAWDRIGQLAVKVAHGVVDMAALLGVVALLAVGGYGLWDSSQVSLNAAADRYASYKPTGDGVNPPFHDLRAINPDVMAWLTVYGTQIDYPVTHHSDNVKYINTDALGRYSLSGAIFLDADNSPDFSDFNNIVYGHHMDKNTMFGEIGLFANQSYFDARRNGSLYYAGQVYGLEFFALVHADAYDATVYQTKLSGRETQRAYLARLTDLAVQYRPEAAAQAGDRLILLSTCSSATTNGRDILVGKITDQVQADPFAAPAKAATGVPAIDRLTGVWAYVPLWGKIAITALVALVALFLVGLIITQRKRRSGRRRQSGLASGKRFAT